MEPTVALLKSVSFTAPPGPKKWYRGSNLVVVTTGKTYLVTGTGKLVLLFNTDEIIFVSGQTQDLLVTRNKEGNPFQINILRDEVCSPLFSIPGGNLNSVHLALDHILVVVVDRKAFGFDLTCQEPDKFPLMGFYVPYEAVTAVYTHYFVVWTRDTRYVVDLAQGPLSSITNTSISKVTYSEPLSMEQEILFATHNLLVTQSPGQLTLYDAAGQTLYKRSIKQEDKVVRCRAVSGGGCGFFCGEFMFYLNSHMIYHATTPLENRNLMILFDSLPYCYDPDKDNLEFPLKKLSSDNSDTVVLMSTTSCTLTVVTSSQLKTLRIGDFARVPTTTALEIWPKMGNSLLANMVTPFVYQCGKMCFVWHIEECPVPCLRLHALGINGVTTPLSSFPVKESELAEKPVWKCSQGVVGLCLDNSIFLFNGLNGKQFYSPVHLGNNMELEGIHHHKRGVWVLIKTRGSQSSIQQIFHVSLEGCLTMLSHLLNGIVFTSHACTTDGTLVLYSPSVQKTLYVQDIWSGVLDTRITMISQQDTDVCVLEEEKDKTFISVIEQEGNSIRAVRKIEVPQDLCPVQDFHHCDIKTVIVGQKKWGIMTGSSTFEIYDLPLYRGNFSIFMPNHQVDPGGRSALIYNSQIVFRINDPANIFRLLKPGENTIVLSPGHFATGITNINPGQGFSQKIENAIIAYVL